MIIEKGGVWSHQVKIHSLNVRWEGYEFSGAASNGNWLK